MIRPMHPDDLASLWIIWQSTDWNGGYHLDEAGFRRALAASTVLVAEVDGAAVGFGRWVGDGVLYAMLHDVVVAGSHRRRGIGRALVTALVDDLRRRGVRCIQLMAAAGTADWYQRLGFRPRPADRPGMTFHPESP